MNKTVKYIIRSLIILVPLKLFHLSVMHLMHCELTSSSTEVHVQCMFSCMYIFIFSVLPALFGGHWIAENWHEIWSDE